MNKIIKLNKISDKRGNLFYTQDREQIPFEIKRIFWINDIPSGQERGGHAHKDLLQFVIAINGSFDLILDDGNSKNQTHLNSPNEGVLILPGIWGELKNFSSDSVCMVFCSEIFEEADYIRDYQEFLEYKKSQKTN